ncbi:MAG: nucleotidyltransferase family protein, partial [Bacteroidales bacterium]
ETATSVAVRLSENNQIEYIAPYGLEDLFQLVVRPTPKTSLEIYTTRVEQKQWKKSWEQLKIHAVT